MSKETPLNIFGIPYDLIETFRWILKHIIYDLFYPLTLVIFILFFFESVPSYFILLAICVSVISLCYFIFYWIQSIRSKEKNIGTYDENRRWRVEILNEIDEKDVIYEIGFVGDIMKMRDYTIKFDKNIGNFFKGIDLIVGNLEGIINDNKTINILRQKHKSAILNDLTNITEPPPKWLLCISNNHSADYKEKWFHATQDAIDGRSNFSSFGEKTERQFYVPREGINIVTGTMWNNYKNEYSSNFREINLYHKPNSFNILYPHWHFENECYVRKEIVKRCKSLFIDGVYYAIRKFLPKRLRRPPIRTYEKKPIWDLIFGHHTHVPQPIVVVPNSKNHKNYLLAYSGGNFTSSKWIAKHQHGLILRCQIAKTNKTDPYAIRSIEWSYTKCKRERKEKIVHSNIDIEHNRKNTYDFRAIKVLKNLVIVTVCYLIFTPIISLLFSVSLLNLIVVFFRAIGVIGIQFFAVWVISRLLFKYKKS
ncbi:MAG: CapA family protein [Candidatus Lokiarchaeota archaeon]|nr:CapA family protein [Candidatus Lokiarchaeota archaeon]